MVTAKGNGMPDDYHTRKTDKIARTPDPVATALGRTVAALHVPTVGRIVHYWPCDLSLLQAKGQPYAAMVTHVWNPNCVNLAVADDQSFRLPEIGNLRSVDRCEATDKPEDRLGKWSWPQRV